MSKNKGAAFTEEVGGVRLYNLFKKKLEKAPPAKVIQRKKPGEKGQEKGDLDAEMEFFITIPLKGAKGGVSQYLYKHKPIFSNCAFLFIGFRNPR